MQTLERQAMVYATKQLLFFISILLGRLVIRWALIRTSNTDWPGTVVVVLLSPIINLMNGTNALTLSFISISKSIASKLHVFRLTQIIERLSVPFPNRVQLY